MVASYLFGIPFITLLSAIALSTAMALEGLSTLVFCTTATGVAALCVVASGHRLELLVRFE